MSHNQTPLTTVRSVIIDLAWNFSYITVNSVILVLYYPSNLLGTGKGGRCEGNIVTFLLGQVVLSLLYSLPQKPLQYFLDHYRPEWKRHPVVMTLWMMWSIITLFDIAWFIAGQVWVFRSSECRPNNPPIFWLALSEIIFFYLTTILPLTVYIILVFIARRRQRFLPPEPGTTGPAAHLRGGLSKVELNSLRTFLFKPAVTVQPIEEKSDLESGLGEPLKTAEEEEGADGDSVSEIPLEEGINHISEEEDEKKVNVAAEADVKPMKIATDRHGVQLDQGSGSGTLATSGPINPATSTADSTDVITSPTADLKKPSTSSPSAYPPQILVSPAATDSSPTDAPSETPVAEVEEPLPPGAATNCAICFSDFEPGDRIRELACHHIFHVDCVDPWLIAASEDAVAHRTCPLCVREAILPEFRDPLC
ncbi:hypothetical protein BC829DRAFT_233829 [Chytridium lagenaria]|nr:hypothetical protein BC829DRAFT_233829 [Chytridium lagenaria]